VKNVKYVQLRSRDDYSDLGQALDLTNDSVRIFYLSISPSLYENVASYINETSRRDNKELRVVFEKPFGRDTASAIDLSAKLQSHLQDEEIYRVIINIIL
jgi:glucose-6-phosphate 1-dehydrogenase